MHERDSTWVHDALLRVGAYPMAKLGARTRVDLVVAEARLDIAAI
jgi:hypothetical protein